MGEKRTFLWIAVCLAAGVGIGIGIGAGIWSTPEATTPQPDVTTPEPEVTTPQPELTTPKPELTTPKETTTTLGDEPEFPFEECYQSIDCINIEIPNFGVITGQKLSEYKNVGVFRNIPFAQPPIGPLRFKPALEQSASYEQPLNGLHFGMKCIDSSKTINPGKWLGFTTLIDKASSAVSGNKIQKSKLEMGILNYSLDFVSIPRWICQ